MKQNPPNPWQTKEKRSIYKNPWIHIEEHDAVNPAGQDCIYGVVKFQNIAVGILPLTANNETYLVGQHRYTLNSYSWEIPEGGCPINEAPLQAAKRELKEETGLEADEWIPLMELYLSNSVTDEKAIVYVAKGLMQGKSNPEPTENITVKKLPFEELYQKVLEGEITDVLTVAPVLKAKALMDKGLL